MSALSALLLLFFATSIVVILTGVLLAKRERSAQLSAIRRLGCPACAASLSEDSVRSADQLWERHVATLMRHSPGTRFRLVRSLAAVCGACGARLQFDKASRTLRPISLVLSFESGSTEN